MDNEHDTLGITLPVGVWQKLFHIANLRQQGINTTLAQMILAEYGRSLPTHEGIQTRRQKEYHENCKQTYERVASGKTIDEVAEELDISTSTVRKRYRYYKRILDYQASLVEDGEQGE